MLPITIKLGFNYWIVNGQWIYPVPNTYPLDCSILLHNNIDLSHHLTLLH